jgi:WD40 repeat protein
MSELITTTTPLRWFNGHEECITAVAVFSDKHRMVTGSYDTTLRLWDFEDRCYVEEDGGASPSGVEIGGTMGWAVGSKR